MSSFANANLINLRKIDLAVFTALPKPDFNFFRLYINNIETKKFKLIKHSSMGNLYFYQIELEEDFCFGKEYVFEIPNFDLIHVSNKEITNLEIFDELFNYGEDDLGAIYTKEETNFAVWAPLASSVVLKIKENDSFTSFEMNRSNNGVYRYSLKGDHLNAYYTYIVTNSGIVRETTDPYGKAVSLNSEYSVVIDLYKIKNEEKYKVNYQIKNYVDNSIYELHVRDFTEGNNTNIINKGKYLGLIEEGRLTKGNHPAGLDYLKYLGVSHVQLQPVTDYFGVDDIKTNKSYNWGYDITSFFSLEGSLSINPKDPISRIYELKEVVNTFHKNDIRVVVDVVFNHIYDYQNSSFEITTPNYYFRKKKNGELSNCSGCGNDFASEKYMARKIILDSVRYFIETYDIDGIRIDLMGLLDIDTVNQIKDLAKSIKDDFFIYGEGWDMDNINIKETKATMNNYKSLTDVAFFNDAFRDFVKGGSFNSNKHEKAYISGNTSYVFGLDFSFFGSILPLSYKPKFDSLNQTINFIECHDNLTVFDKLLNTNTEDEALDRCKLGLAITIMSFGIPFIHMGQEIGLSKHGIENSYNVLKINNMDWKLVDARYDMVVYMHHLLKMRKYKMPFLHLSKKEDIENLFQIEHWYNNVYCLRSKNKIDNYQSLVLLINPTSEVQTYELNDYYTYLSAPDKNAKNIEMHFKNGIIPPCSMQILYK